MDPGLYRPMRYALDLLSHGMIMFLRNNRLIRRFASFIRAPTHIVSMTMKLRLVMISSSQTSHASRHKHWYDVLNSPGQFEEPCAEPLNEPRLGLRVEISRVVCARDAYSGPSSDIPIVLR